MQFFFFFLNGCSSKFMLFLNLLCPVGSFIGFMLCVLQGRFSVPLLDAAQTRRVVVSHNVDKALKEGEQNNLNSKNANSSNNVTHSFVKMCGTEEVLLEKFY